MDGDRPRSRSITPSENCSPSRRTQSLPPAVERARSPPHSDTDALSYGTNGDVDAEMEDEPDAEEDTIRLSGASNPPTVGDGLQTDGRGTDGSVDLGQFEVQSQPLRLSPNDPWPAVTQVIVDAIHDIRAIFHDARADLLTAQEPRNVLQAIYNPIANAADTLGEELDDIFVHALGMEPRHYRWLLRSGRGPTLRRTAPPTLAATSGAAMEPATSGGPPQARDDVPMDDTDARSMVSALTVLSSGPSSRAMTPQTPRSDHSRTGSVGNQRRDKGKGKARAERVDTPPPTATPTPYGSPAAPMRKRQRSDTATSYDEARPYSSAPNLPNPRTVELLMRRYPNATLEQILSISDAYAGTSTATYAEVAARPATPASTASSRGSARAASRNSTRVEAEVKRKSRKRRRVRTPRGAASRLYVRFARPPMGEARESPLTMVCAINDTFANHPDENMQMRVMSADWTAAGQIIFQFLDVPREGAENIIRDFVHARNWGPGNDLNMITVERHIRTSQLCFRGVACIGDDRQPLDARQVAEAAFRNSPMWQEMLPLIRRVSFIPPPDGLLDDHAGRRNC
ncbi:hypothetical protein ONZ51_g2323 [Trametes cubensis]|uniref:Uncharacterized protein n=1 Tax=Trametes cubensis TaxID=1111947 RepID=A0AAD7U2G8_9APHY|nr:hypothetical protein ONZ51_g2323 [Trametes cubensis]